MEFTDEELSVIFNALEFVEERYLNSRFNFVREELLKKIGEYQDASA